MALEKEKAVGMVAGGGEVSWDLAVWKGGEPLSERRGEAGSQRSRKAGGLMTHMDPDT